MSVNKIKNKIRRFLTKLRLQPIRVFCFHHVSDIRDPLICQIDDWTQLNQFKQNIEKLQERYTFISLSEAYRKLSHDKLRLGHYAVLTNDDGLASVLNVIPWLEERKIPLTLFINTRYMEGNMIKPVHQKWLHELAPYADEKIIAKKMYLSKEQVFKLSSPYIEIGLHGHEHLDARLISEDKFEEEYNICFAKLHTHPRFISAYAYPWGHGTANTFKYLWKKNILPLVLNGGVNYMYEGYIDRECLDNRYV